MKDIKIRLNLFSFCRNESRKAEEVRLKWEIVVQREMTKKTDGKGQIRETENGQRDDVKNLNGILSGKVGEDEMMKFQPDVIRLRSFGRKLTWEIWKLASLIRIL